MGTTTCDEYRKHIEKDAALARRFQPIFVTEPSVDETIGILRGMASTIEQHHKVHISDDALVSAAKLSHRYLTERKLPDKAIDLIDEAASRQRMRFAAKSALSSSSSEASTAAGANVLATADQETSSSSSPSSVTSMDAADSSEGAGSSSSDDGEWSDELVTDNDIADMVSKSTGIPVGRLVAGERESLLDMENAMRKRIVGQDAALALVSKSIRLSRAGLRYHDRPVGVFMLLGPTGVGKTELSKALTEFIFHDPAAMLRVDMSEYMERFAVSRLIGAPPGYVGYQEGGVLTEAVRRRPFQVVLLDEFEKAHRDVCQ